MQAVRARALVELLLIVSVQFLFEVVVVTESGQAVEPLEMGFIGSGYRMRRMIASYCRRKKIPFRIESNVLFPFHVTEPCRRPRQLAATARVWRLGGPVFQTCTDWPTRAA